MPATIIATPGASNANSFATQAEIDDYFAARAPLSPVWVASDATNIPIIIMAQRILSSFAVARKVLKVGTGSYGSYYLTSQAWTGTIATSTQSLPWGRIGMYDRLGRLIPDGVIPIELKEAQAELAGILKSRDTTAELAQVTQGLLSLKAGPVELKFKEIIESAVIPDAVLSLLPGSWLTDEIITPARRFFFKAS